MRARRWIIAAILSLAVVVLGGCRAEELLRERLEAAANLPPAGIAAILTGGTFVSEDITCVTAGVLVSKGLISYLAAVLACMGGVWTSDMILYGIGALGRGGMLERRPFRWFISLRRVEQGRLLFQRHGAKMVISSRFLPGSRLPLYVAAGLLRYPFSKFAGWMALAALLWTPVIIGFAMKLGGALLAKLEAYEKAAWVILPGVILLIWLTTRLLEFAVTQAGRRRLAAKWRQFRGREPES